MRNIFGVDNWIKHYENTNNCKLENFIGKSYKEIDDIFKAFFLSGVPELDSSTDLGYAETLNRVAVKYGIKYILAGTNLATEGMPMPPDWNWFKYDKKQSSLI